VYLHPTIHEQAAAYLFHLIKNHPFVDGNKRVAYATMRIFLEVNGYRLDLSQDENYELVMAVAEGRLSKEEVAANLVKAAVPK